MSTRELRRDRTIHTLRGLMLLTLLALPAAPAASTQPPPDAEATELARRVLTAMGGEEAWEATRFIRFDFFGRRLHHWDRHTGRHRLEGTTREGETYVVLQNIHTREGTVVVDGEPQSGEAKAAWLERAYGAWVNDTYWLLMPYKLLDPGVHLTSAGEQEIDGVTYDTLRLRFDQVGLTPGDTYWAYINRDTGLMERWAYFLQGWEEDREPTHWQWLDWGRYGRILLSPRRFSPTDDREAHLGDLAVFDTLPDAVFESVEPVELD